MKQLKDFIIDTDSNIVEDYIDYNILQHLAIKYKENHVYSRRRVILEKYGIYNGCEELANFIYKEVKKKGMDYQYTFDRNDLKSFPNIFFNKIIIDIDCSSNDGGEYIDNDSLNDDLLFDEVNINIYQYENNISEVKEILMHELTHAYNNYMMILKGDEGYLNTAKSLLYKNIQKQSDNTNEYLIKKALYLLLGYERNAFFGEIKAELEQHKDKIKGPYDALNVLKNSKVYKAYKKLDREINAYFNGSLLDKNIKEIEDAYYEITHEKKTANQIFKTLRSLSKKALKKLDNQLPKLCIENLNNILVTDDTNMIKFLQ